MPKVSKASAAEVQDIGIGTVSSEVAGGYEFAFLDLREEPDMAPLLKGLPDDRCHVPPLGLRHARSGHVHLRRPRRDVRGRRRVLRRRPATPRPSAAGTEYLLISPADENLEEVDAVIQRNIEALQTA